MQKNEIGAAVSKSAVEEMPTQPVPVPQAAWATLERLQLAAQVSQQQLQVFVDGLALGQGVAQGARLVPLDNGGWGWTGSSSR